MAFVGAGYIWWANNRVPAISQPENQQEIVEQKQVSPEEQEFNDSGQAKAIEDESDLWPFYDNPEVGISFNYPPEVILLEDDTVIDSEQIYLDIDIREIGQQDIPTDLDYDKAMENIQELSGGDFGTAYGFAFEDSQQVRSVGFLFAQDYLVLARFEVCDVALERKLRFYFNNKQITLTLFGPVDSLKQTMPQYFITDQANCGDEKMWDFEKQNDFYQTLINGEGSSTVQGWFDAFDAIAEEIIFAHR